MFFEISAMKIPALILILAFGIVPRGFSNLIADPTFANSTTIDPLTTTSTQDGNWDFVQLSPPGGAAKFPATMQFDTKGKGDIYATPLDVGGSQIQLTNGQAYAYSVTVFGPSDRDVFLYAGATQQVALLGGGGGGVTYSGTFTATATGSLSFVIPSADPKMGLTNLSLDPATPEPRSVIFCVLLGVGICCVERDRLRKIFACSRSD